MSETLRLYLEKQKKIIKDTKEKVAKIWRQLVDEEKLLIKEREELTGPPDTKPKTFNQEQVALKKAREEMFTEEYKIKQEKIREINHKIDIIHQKRGVMNWINIDPPVTGQPTHLHGQAYVDWVQRRLNAVDAHHKYKPSPRKVSITRIPVSASSTSDEPIEIRPAWLPPPYPPPPPPSQSAIKTETNRSIAVKGKDGKLRLTRAMGGKNKKNYTKRRTSRKHKKTRRTRR